MAPRLGEAERAAEGLLTSGHVVATELVASIHAVNPTGLDLAPAVERRRYALKSRLQSRLILEFFSDLELEAVSPGVIGLRYRPQNRDACHAVLSELTLDARSKVQFHLDTHDAGVAPSPSGASKSSRRATSLLGQGRKALSEYDYETARRCFDAALEQNEEDEAPALALLELLVDHLASWDEALAVEERLGARQLTPPVRTLLALAAAQTGDAAQCQRLARELESPRLASAFCALARRALERSEFDETARLVAQARGFDASAPELVDLEAELARRKTAQREPAERALHALQGDELERQAQLILARWPESAPARKVLRELESKRTSARIAQLEQQAEAALAAGDDETARARWAEAQGLGATGLEPKLASASARLERRARAQRLEAVTLALRAAWSEASVERYLELATEERRGLREQLGEEALDWLEVLGASDSRDWKLDVAAVLALKELKARPPPAAEVVLRLRPHEARVLQLPVGRALLAAAEAELRSAAAREVSERLAAAQRALEEGQWKAALELADALQRSAPEEAGRIAGAARAALVREARRAQFEGLVTSANLLEALGVLRAAERDPTEAAAAWSEGRTALNGALRGRFKVEVFRSAEGMAVSDVFDASLVEASHGLDARGEYAYQPTGFGPHLFVRKIDVRAGRLVELAAFTLPCEFDFPNVRVEGATLWVTNDEGVALQLAIEDWELLRWHVGNARDGERFEGSLVTPGGRFHWLAVSDADFRNHALRLIDLERGKLQREAPMEGGLLRLVATAAGLRVWLNGYESEGHLFALGGATELTLPAGVQELCVSPTGAGLLAVAEPSDGGLEDSGLRVLHYAEGSNEPGFSDELADSFIDGNMQLVTSRDAHASFVVYQGEEDSSWLVAYVAHGATVERAWRVRCPERALLLQDLEARRVVLMAPAKSGLRCVPLTAERPELAELDPGPAERRPPRLSPGETYCSTHGDMSLEDLDPLLRSTAGAARRQGFERLFARIKDKPEALTWAAKELRRGAHPELAEVKSLLARSSTQPWVKLDAAEVAVSKGEWKVALDELGPLVVPSEVEGTVRLSPRAARHWHHLRGLALFHLDRLEEAREAFAAATTDDEAGCDTKSWAEWLEAMAGRDKTSSMGKLVEAVRAADGALAARDPRRALEHLDVTLVWALLDVQLGARLATAALEAPVGPRTRLMVAAFLREVDTKYSVRLPLGRLAWPAEQLEAVAVRARRWMDRIGAYPSRGKSEL